MYFILTQNSRHSNTLLENSDYVASSPLQETYGGTKYRELWLGTLAFGMILAAFYLTLYISTAMQRAKSPEARVSICYRAYSDFSLAIMHMTPSKGLIKGRLLKTYNLYNEIQAGRDVTDAIEKYDSGLYRSEKRSSRTVNDILAYGMKVFRIQARL